MSDSGKVSGAIGLLFMAAIVAGLGGTGVVWIWPDGITEQTLASVTVGTLLRAIAACGLAVFVLVVVWILLSPLFDEL
ncbi:MAG: hypothetical protein AAB834_06265 [Patescibacteria group bacterium]